jgi:hypothetical protein
MWVVNSSRTGTVSFGGFLHQPDHGMPGRAALRPDQGQLLAEIPRGARPPVGQQRADFVEDQQVQRRLPRDGDLPGAVGGERPLGGLHVLHVLADQRPTVAVVVGTKPGRYYRPDPILAFLETF